MIKGVIGLIAGDATVAALVGEYNDEVKVFPVVAEQEVKRPYVTVRRLTQGSTIVKGQASDKDVPFFNVAAYATTYQKCVEILTAIRAVIDDYQGTSEGVTYHRIWYQSSEDLFDSEDRTFVVVDSYVARVSR